MLAKMQPRKERKSKMIFMVLLLAGLSLLMNAFCLAFSLLACFSIVISFLLNERYRAWQESRPEALDRNLLAYRRVLRHHNLVLSLVAIFVGASWLFSNLSDYLYLFPTSILEAMFRGTFAWCTGFAWLSLAILALGQIILTINRYVDWVGRARE
jgi:accessory gene regulator protein AgrB